MNYCGQQMFTVPYNKFQYICIWITCNLFNKCEFPLILLYSVHGVISVPSPTLQYTSNVYLFIHLLAIILMQAGPVQLQAGLNGGLLRTYWVKQDVSRNTKYKRSLQHKLQLTHRIYNIYVTLQSTLHQLHKWSLRNLLKIRQWSYVLQFTS